MKWSKPVFLFTAITTSTFVYSISLLANPYDEYQYRDVQEIRAMNRFQQGWLPTILPESSNDFSIFHSEALNSSYGSFTVPKRHMIGFTQKLYLIKDGEYFYSHTKGAAGWVFKINFKTGKVSYRYN